MTIRTLLSSYVSGFRFYRGFLLPYFVMLRKVAPDVSHHLQDFYSACCYPLIFKHLSHFPRLFIWRYIFGQYPSRLISSVNSVACHAFKKITYITCMIPYYSVMFSQRLLCIKIDFSILIQTYTAHLGHPWSDPFVVK